MVGVDVGGTLVDDLAIAADKLRQGHPLKGAPAARQGADRHGCEFAALAPGREAETGIRGIQASDGTPLA